MLRKIFRGDFCHVGFAEEPDFDINGLQVGRSECERLDRNLVASEGELHPLAMRTIYADRSRSYLAGIIVPVGGLCESQGDIGRLLSQPYGNSKFVLNQDVLTVLEVARMDYQRLCERVGFTDTSDDGEGTKMGAVSVENQERSSDWYAYFPPPPLSCGGGWP